jgi:hypothetical protein
MLNKCKFCGSFDTTMIVKLGKGEKGKTKYTYYVTCLACHARGSSFSNLGRIDTSLKQKAEMVWNRTPQEGRDTL